MEPMGFEPTTSSMPSRRAPNCATAPLNECLEFITVGERESWFQERLNDFMQKQMSYKRI